MDTEGFRITQLSFYNYGQKDLSGSITLQHNKGGQQNEMKLIMNAADCSKIVNVVADRIAETIHEAARQFWVDVGMPMREFMPETEPINQLEGGAEPDPAFGGQKED